jgi:hypothetical protein
LVLFYNRNPRISLRKTEGTRIGSIIFLNHDKENHCFGSLMLVMEKHKFFESKMFDVDGTRISTVQNPANNLGPKG